MKRASHKSSSFEGEEASNSQQEMTQQSNMKRESAISSSNQKASQSMRDSSNVQNEAMDEPTHSMARQEAQKEIEIARGADDAQEVSRAEMFEQLIPGNDSRTSGPQRHTDRDVPRDIMSAPNGAKTTSVKQAFVEEHRDDAIFTQNQLKDFDTSKLPSQQPNDVRNQALALRNREVMTAPFGQTRGARMYAQGFGQTQNKANHIADTHLFHNVNHSLDTAQQSDAPPEPSVRRTSQRAQVLQQCFVESDLLKATNIYQQFDRKGNLFENRLYAKTSINQAKLNKEQTKYENAMASHPDETCRIMNGSMSGEEDLNATSGTAFGRSQMGTAGPAQFGQTGMSSINKSQQSHSLNNINIVAKTGQHTGAVSPKPLSRQTRGGVRGDRTGRNRTVTGNMNRMAATANTDMRCTFSRANGPRIATADMLSNPNKPYGELPMMNQTMFEKLMSETNEVNKSANLSNNAKTTQNNSLMSAQRSISKLRQLHEVVNGWSMRDQDLASVTHGVGGPKKTFQTAQNFMTNDPQFFKMRSVSHSKRLEQMPLSDRLNLNGYENLPYFFCQTPANETSHKLSDAIKITDSNAVFATSKLLNMQGKQYYSQMLDGKGQSNVFNYQTQPINQDPAGDLRASRIQKKAYRANTQSSQVDGLFKPHKFQARVNLLNNSRVDYNIIRPTETKDSLRSTHQSRPDAVLESMRTGKCHQVYGISEFNQNTRLAGIKLHEKYQGSIKNDQNTFRRVNGDFTAYANSKYSSMIR